MIEPDVRWPDLEKPVVIKRDLVLVLHQKTSKKSDLIVCADISLEVLVNGCLYVVAEDSDHLRRGQVLSRNLDLTRKHSGSLQDQASHCFIRFDGVNDARRGIGRIDGRYRRVESPDLTEWRKQLDWMMRQAWSLHKDEAVEVTSKF